MNNPVISILFLSMSLFACTNKTETESRKAGQEIFFEAANYNFGDIEEGMDTIFTIEFKNIGEKPILVNRVRSSCGCTVPTWSKEPVEPGKKGIIQVKYNTQLPGSFSKRVTVYSTAANSPVTLYVKGKVLPKETTG